jgi:hypothetical protein
MNINSIPKFTFTCFDSSIGCIEKFLNADSEEATKENKLAVFKTKEEVYTVFDKFEELKRTRRMSIETKQNSSIEAFFFNSSTKPDKTIMIASPEDGWYNLGSKISKQLPCGRYYFLLCDESVPEPMNFFRYTNGNIERSVYSMKEGKWIFYQQGEALSFEDLSNYKQRMIKKRVTRQILIDYCEKLGLLIRNETFWEATGESLHVKYSW